MALKGPSAYAYQCLLIGHDQTCRGRALTAEFDPNRTSRKPFRTPHERALRRSKPVRVGAVRRIDKELIIERQHQPFLQACGIQSFQNFLWSIIDAAVSDTFHSELFIPVLAPDR